MKKIIENAVERFLPGIIQLRHEIHREPELSFKEINTSALITRSLRQLGISYRDRIAGTGVLAEIRGEVAGECGRTLLLRADMDALPVTEESGLEFCSLKPGVMHACGHDIHTAVLLCCAAVLNAVRSEFCGTVKLMFQPGEETSGGAKPMIDSGILENPAVDSCAALHIEPSLTVGQAGFKAGAAYSCPDEFYIKIIGHGGHAAYPHRCTDPVVIAAQVICALQTIASRSADPLTPVVVSVCAVNGGTAYNVIPDEVELRGTARSFSSKDREMLENQIEKITAGICGMYGAEYEYRFDRLFPPLINDKKTIERLMASAELFLGRENIVDITEPTMAGEDFAYLTEAVPRSALFWLGSTSEGCIKYPLHNSRLAASDDCIKYGAEILCGYALSFLDQNQQI